MISFDPSQMQTQICRFHLNQIEQMYQKDFQGIQKFKVLILLIVLSLIAANILGPLFYYETYLQVFITFQKLYMVRVVGYVVMTAIATLKALKIIRRVETGTKREDLGHRNIHHAIVIPICNESLELLEVTLQQLASHSKANSQYLLFLALENNSDNPTEKGERLKIKFESCFKMMHYSIHILKPGEAPGKASNQNCCLEQMESVLLRNGIDPASVMFTTLDSDNWMPEAYFEEMEFYLSENGWKMDKYMFAPGQMFSINNTRVPLLNRVIDTLMGAVLFIWSNNLTKVQNAASNYSLSFNRLKKHDFFDTNSDAMCDDFHNSMKYIWKSQGEIEIIPIFVLANMMSLETGQGYLADSVARFWQAERHMRVFLDAAYNFNMLFKNPFRWRTLWTTLAYFQNHFIALGLYLTAIMFIIFKLIAGLEFTADEIMIFRLQGILTTILYLFYFIVINRSSKVFFKQEGISWVRFIELIVFNKFAALFFASIPEVVATVRLALTTPTYETAVKRGPLTSKDD